MIILHIHIDCTWKRMHSVVRRVRVGGWMVFLLTENVSSTALYYSRVSRVVERFFPKGSSESKDTMQQDFNQVVKRGRRCHPIPTLSPIPTPSNVILYVYASRRRRRRPLPPPAQPTVVGTATLNDKTSYQPSHHREGRTLQQP